MAMAILAGVAAALLTGQFEGSGSVCHGKLSLNAGALTWQSSAANCVGVPYKVLEQAGSDQRGTLVLQIDSTSECGFGVVKVEFDEKKPEAIAVTGFASVADFKNPRLLPYEKLECSVRRVDNKS